MEKKSGFYRWTLLGLLFLFQAYFPTLVWAQGQETVAIIYIQRPEMNLHGNKLQTILPIVRNNRLYVSLADLAKILDLKPNQIYLQENHLDIITNDVSVNMNLPAYSMTVNGSEMADQSRIGFGGIDLEHTYLSIRPILKAFGYDGFLREDDQSFYILKGSVLTAQDFLIQGLEIGHSTLKELEGLFGKPFDVAANPSTLTTGYLQTWNYHEIQFDAMVDADARPNSVLTAARWTTPLFVTSRGVRVGQDLSAMIAAYGYGYYKNRDTGRYEYTLLTPHWQWKGLAFRFEGNKISEIELFDRVIR